jgi:hypothetical protein
MKPALVTLTVTAFRGVLSTPARAKKRGTGYRMKVSERHPHVREHPDRLDAKGNPTWLLVKPRGDGVTIRFRIKSQSAKDVYHPLGIAFERHHECDCDGHDPLGKNVFKREHIQLREGHLEITSSFHGCDKGKSHEHKFSVIIQRERDGQIGIIDPGIVHESSIGIIPPAVNTRVV